jgi:predicted amidohydrolase
VTRRVAAVQFEPALGQTAYNRSRLLALAEQALAQRASLVVLPEMATSGYCFHDAEEVAPCAEPVPGPSTEAFAALAARHRAAIVLGLPEVDPETGVLYNAVVAVGAGGVLGHYRKIHSFVSEPRWAMDGNLGPVVCDTPAGRVGLLCCMDIEYGEMGRALQKLGASILAFPTNWLEERSPSMVWWARAYELGLPLVAANRVGVERGVHFSGGSAIFASDGSLLAEADSGEAVLWADVGEPVQRPWTDPPPPRACLPLTRSSHLYDPHQFFRLYGRPDLPTGGLLPAHALAWRGTIAELPSLLSAHPGLVLLPEDALPELSDGTAEDLTKLVQEHSAFLALGAVSRGRSRLLLIGPEGVLQRREQPAEERSVAPSLANVGPVRVGLVFGRDLHRPEASRLAALAGADALLVADRGSALRPKPHPGTRVLFRHAPSEGDPFHYFLPRVRARTDDLYVLYASHDLPCAAYLPTFDLVGTHDPHGVSITLDTRRVVGGVPNPVRYKYHLQKRRPEAYQALWTPTRPEG